MLRSIHLSRSSVIAALGDDAATTPFKCHEATSDPFWSRFSATPTHPTDKAETAAIIKQRLTQRFVLTM